MLPVCPKCDVGLIVLQFKSVEVDFCEACRGVWLDAGEFEALLQATGANPANPLPANTATRKTRYMCPRCDTHLEELTAGNELLLDRCPRGHGLWFDADELEHLLLLCPAEAQAARTIEFLNDLFGKTIKEKAS
jgi:Zn-finger nucleic acid-binding protein